MSLIKLEYTDVVSQKLIKKNLQFSSELITVPYKLESLFVLKVEGESMQPLIKDTSLIVADLSQTNPTNNDIYIVSKDNKLWIKKVKINSDKVSFESINEKYSHLVYKSNEVRVIARAVLTFTSL